MTAPSPPPLRLLGFLLLPLVGACSPQSAAPGVQGPSESDERPMPLGATSEQRFGGMPAAPAAAAPAQPRPSTNSDAGGYHFNLPAGWSEGGAKPMRDVNLVAPGGVECWLTRLGPGAGGLQANVDRWRSQLGLGPLSPEQVAALPTRAFLGGEAVFLDLTSADGASRMVGLMQFLADRSMFLRMSGPAEAVEANLAGFEELRESLHDGSGHTHDEPAPAPAATGGAPTAGGGAGKAGSAGGLRWVAPASWGTLEPDSFRLAWFQVAPGVQCWITTLAGNGGGVEANVTRWYGQFGRNAPSAAELAGLPTIPVLGRDALFVDLLGEGDADGMIGVLCELPAQAVFVKIQGPSDEVRAHVAAFREFCASLGLQ